MEFAKREFPCEPTGWLTIRESETSTDVWTHSSHGATFPAHLCAVGKVTLHGFRQPEPTISSRIPVGSADWSWVSEGWALKLIQCYFCLTLSAEAGHLSTPSLRGEGNKDTETTRHGSLETPRNLLPQWEIKQNPNRKTDNEWEQIIHLRGTDCQQIYKHIFNSA